jgi:hypothetical protein
VAQSLQIIQCYKGDNSEEITGKNLGRQCQYGLWLRECERDQS